LRLMTSGLHFMQNTEKHKLQIVARLQLGLCVVCAWVEVLRVLKTVLPPPVHFIDLGLPVNLKFYLR
jgi:hypothetical protein